MSRSISVLAAVLGSICLAVGVFAAQPPGPAPKAAPPPGATPAPKAAPPATPPGTKPFIVDKVDQEQKKKRSQVTLKILRAPAFGPGEQQLFDTYYTNYALARWSDWEGSAASIARFRKELRTDLQNAGKGPVHDHLVSLVLDFMKVRAREHYHPATRFNAMLMIGDLNRVEGKAPAPLPAALPELISAFKDAQRPDAVKIAALVGIVRHAKLQAVQAPGDVQAVNALALATAASQPPAGRSADGHAWIRKLAAEVLGELRGAGNAAPVATTLSGIVTDAESPFFVRCAAAEALGKLDYTDAAGLDAAKLAAPLGSLAADACASEAKAQEEAEKRAEAQPPVGMPPGFGQPRGFPSPLEGGMEGLDGGRTRVEPPKQIAVVFRNRLRNRVQAASVGLSGTEEKPGGVASVATGSPDADFIATVKKHVEAILTRIEKTRTAEVGRVTAEEQKGLKEMMVDIKTEADQLRAALSKATVPTPPTPPASNP